MLVNLPRHELEPDRLRAGLLPVMRLEPSDNNVDALNSKWRGCLFYGFRGRQDNAPRQKV